MSNLFCKELEKQKPLSIILKGWGLLAPRVGFEPTTLRLTAGCSTVELPRNNASIILI
jgi:hypothetical protein